MKKVNPLFSAQNRIYENPSIFPAQVIFMKIKKLPGLVTCMKEIAPCLPFPWCHGYQMTIIPSVKRKQTEEGHKTFIENN